MKNQLRGGVGSFDVGRLDGFFVSSEPFFSNLFPSSFDCAALWHIAMSVAKHFKKMTTSKVNQSVDFFTKLEVNGAEQSHR